MSTEEHTAGDARCATPEFDYSFSVWPAEHWGFTRATYDLFRMLSGRVEMTFTHVAFEAFRSSLNRNGLTLREIERRPHHEPEIVL